MSGKNKFLTKLAAFIGENVTEAQADELLADAEVTKAIHTASIPLKDSENVTDITNAERHSSVPSKEELKVGPAEFAHGGNAPRMIGQYSDMTAQHGLAKLAEDLGHMLSELTGVTKSQTDAINRQGELLVSLVKAAETADEPEVDFEQAKDIIHAHAKSNIDSAVAKLTEAASVADRAPSVKSSKARKGMEVIEQKLIKAATDLLEEVRDAVTFVNDDKLTVAYNMAAIKAGFDADDDDDDDDDDMKKKKKKDGDAKKAEEPVVEQAVEAAPSQVAESLKAEFAQMNEKIEKAVNGLGMIKTDVQGLMRAVQGQPKNDQPNPDLFAMMKSNPATTLDVISTRIDDAGLEGAEYAAATNIFSKLTAVNNGMMDASVLQKMIADQPSNIRNLFANAA